MRIVHIVWSMTPGGLESMLLDICRVQSICHEVHVVVMNAQYDASLARSSAGEYTVHRIDRPVGSRNPWFLAKVYARLKCLRPDIIHLHQLSLMNALHCASAPLVATVHDTRFDLPRNPNRFRRVICISEAVERAVRAALPTAVTKIIYNGVRAAEIANRPRSAGREFRIVQISRLVHEKKGQDVLLRALKHVQAHHGELHIKLDFIGGGPSLAFLREMVAEFSLTEQVRFLGEVSRADIYRQLCDYDLLVQPSRYEGFGLTIVEAMMAGVPVLVSNIEGPMEVIHSGAYGDYFVSGDAIDLANKLVELAQRAPRDKALSCEQARRHALEEFEISLTAERYCALYEDVLATCI
jgi:glycosyltransferase involved in cell wall biosynthesis